MLILVFIFLSILYVKHFEQNFMYERCYTNKVYYYSVYTICIYLYLFLLKGSKLQRFRGFIVIFRNKQVINAMNGVSYCLISTFPF